MIDRCRCHRPQAAIDPGAQLLVLSRYCFTFVVALVLYLSTPSSAGMPAGARSGSSASGAAKASPPKRAASAAQSLLLLLMGSIDVAAFSAYNLGFSACGAALSMLLLAAGSQAVTAVISVTVLRRRLTSRHIVALVLATAGLVIRGSGAGAGAKEEEEAQRMYGLGLVLLSAALFSVSACLWEVISGPDAPGGVAVPKTQVPLAGHSGSVATSACLEITMNRRGEYGCTSMLQAHTLVLPMPHCCAGGVLCFRRGPGSQRGSSAGVHAAACAHCAD